MWGQLAQNLSHITRIKRVWKIRQKVKTIIGWVTWEFQDQTATQVTVEYVRQMWRYNNILSLFSKAAEP